MGQSGLVLATYPTTGTPTLDLIEIGSGKEGVNIIGIFSVLFRKGFEGRGEGGFWDKEGEGKGEGR